MLPIDSIDIQMSLGNLMCPMGVMDICKGPMDPSFVRSIYKKLLKNSVGLLHNPQTGNNWNISGSYNHHYVLNFSPLVFFTPIYSLTNRR